MSGQSGIQSSIGQRLRSERRRLRLTQVYAADLVKVCKQTWGEWETDKTSPNAVTLALFAQVGADVLFIVTGEPTPLAPLDLASRRLLHAIVSGELVA